MKKSMAALGLLGLMVHTAYAGSGGQGSPAAYELTGGVVFLQPTGSNLDYAVLGYPFPVQSPHWSASAVYPGYSAGFDVAGRYIFKDSKADVALAWTRVTTSDSDSTYAGSGQFAVPLFQAGPSFGQTINNASQIAHATAAFNFNVVNLDAGYPVEYGQNTQVRFYAGLSGAQITEKLSASFQDIAATYMMNSINNSQYTGVGPLLGAEGRYQLPYHLGITGGLAASGLIGGLKASTNYISSSPQLAAAGITTNYQSINPRNSTQVVPGLDGKLGLNFTHSFTEGTMVTVDAGYAYATYFNAIVAYNPNTVFGEVSLGTIALSSLGKSVSNFSVNGPYVNLSVLFS